MRFDGHAISVHRLATTACRRQSGKRVDWTNNSAHGLGAPTQPYRAEVARAEPSLGRRATLPGDAENRRRPVAVRHIQRVSAGHTGTRRDVGPRPSVGPQRILER